jgi:hypothetical protein
VGYGKLLARPLQPRLEAQQGRSDVWCLLASAPEPLWAFPAPVSTYAGYNEQRSRHR